MSSVVAVLRTKSCDSGAVTNLLTLPAMIRFWLRVPLRKVLRFDTWVGFREAGGRPPRLEAPLEPGVVMDSLPRQELQ
jgi:hypothetical protein